MSPRRLPWAAVAGLALVWLVAGLAPLEAVLGAGRLIVLAAVVTGTWLTVGRARVPDLSAGLHAVVGALVGGITPTVLELPAWLGAPLAVAAGALTGAVTAGLLARTGRIRGGVATLALTATAPPLAAAWPGSGGAAGFHAVPLLSGSDALDLAIVATVLTIVAVAALGVAEGRSGSRAAVALAAPQVSEAEGVRAAAAAAPLGAAGGALLATAGWAAAVLTGSMVPDAFGLPLTGLAVVGAVLAGGAAWAAPLGGLLLGAPAVVLPLAPVVGDAPPLLTTGALAVIVVLWRGPLTPLDGPTRSGALPSPAPVEGLRVEVDGDRLPRAPRVHLVAEPGESLQLIGPNGVGKSTLLAMLGGQLDDGGAVRLDGDPAPTGAVARARLGLARTWQRPPAVRGADLLPFGVAAPTDPGRAQVAAATSRAPRLLLLDEPSAFLEPDELARLLADARDSGVTVIIVEHRAVAGVDRTVQLPTPDGGGA